MTDEYDKSDRSDAAKIEAVTRALVGTDGTFDNNKTMKREFWTNGRLTHERPAAGCSVFYREWGSYPQPPNEP